MVAPGSIAPGSIVPGEFAMRAEDFRALAALLHRDAGICLTEAKASLVYSRLARRLRALGLASFRDYCALVSAPEGAAERAHMLSALTTNVTKFFREPHHFDHLRKATLPPLLARVQRGARLRLWSAACSSGPEPYSMALTVLALLPDAAERDVRVLATDIDPAMVAAGREGRYDAAALEPVGPEQRARWFERCGDNTFAAGPALRRLVAFRALNLLGGWPTLGLFDAIFCRNVVIYFDDATQRTVWQRLVPRLAPAGRLYIGHSERVTGEALRRLRSDGVTTYALRDADAAPRAPGAP